jgi:integrase/recombinase XerD
MPRGHVHRCEPAPASRLMPSAGNPSARCRARTEVQGGAKRGLHAAEVVSLKVADIDGKRMIIRVEQACCQDGR